MSQYCEYAGVNLIQGWRWLRLGLPATKRDIEQATKQIMSAITDWAAQEQADLDKIKATLEGIVAGISALDKLITDLQNSPGTLSPEDQAALDAIKSASDALVTQSAAIVVTPPGQ